MQYQESIQLLASPHGVLTPIQSVSDWSVLYARKLVNTISTEFPCETVRGVVHTSGLISLKLPTVCLGKLCCPAFPTDRAL